MAIQIKHGKKTYKMEFNRLTLLELIDRGFSLSNTQIDRQFLFLPDIVECSLKMNHPDITKKDVDSLYEILPDKAELYAHLLNLIQDVIDTMLEEDKSKNVTWEIIKPKSKITQVKKDIST